MIFMKKIFFAMLLLFIFCPFSNAENAFVNALRKCDKYSQLGGASYENQYYNILITLEKNRKKCTYKEKIYQQNSGSQTLVCNFNMEDLAFIADNQDYFTKAYAKEVAKNRIHEAKLTNNGAIFEKYLINPKICTVEKKLAK